LAFLRFFFLLGTLTPPSSPVLPSAIFRKVAGFGGLKKVPMAFCLCCLADLFGFNSICLSGFKPMSFWVNCSVMAFAL